MKLIGIDLGGTNVVASIVENGTISNKHSEKTVKSNEDDLINQLVACILKVCTSANLKPSLFDGIGIATPGFVDSEKGIVIASPNTPLNGCELAKLIETRTGIPTKIENDANCAVLGEQQYGAAQGSENVIMLTLGTGLGAGVILKNRLISGIGATELGHIVLKMGGHPCGCGRFGCTEQYVSATALIRIAKEKAQFHPKSLLNECDIDGEVVFALAKTGDTASKMALREYIGNMSEAILNFIAIFGPSGIVLGGGISNAGDAFFYPLRKQVETSLQGTIFSFKADQIVQANLLNDAGIYGAVTLFSK